jgi:hypothetical protein
MRELQSSETTSTKGQTNMLKIEIETDNAAFEYPREECARILRDIADSLEGGRNGGVCIDANGNRVGTWELADEGEIDPIGAAFRVEGGQP